MLQNDLLGSYVSTAQGFETKAAALEVLSLQIPKSGATPAQMAQANVDFSALKQIIDEATTKVAAGQVILSGFFNQIEGDVVALNAGSGSLPAALDAFPIWYVNELAKLRTIPIFIGAMLKEFQEFADDYYASLKTFRKDIANGIGAGKLAASAILQLSVQWSVLNKVTERASQNIAAASARNLGSILTTLDIGTAKNEWATLATLAQEIIDNSQLLRLPPERDREER